VELRLRRVPRHRGRPLDEHRPVRRGLGVRPGERLPDRPAVRERPRGQRPHVHDLDRPEGARVHDVRLPRPRRRLPQRLRIGREPERNRNRPDRKAMLRYTLRRVPSAIVVLLVASVLVFAVPRLAEGDAADVLAGPDATAATRAAVRADLGLDQGVVTQYLTW